MKPYVLKMVGFAVGIAAMSTVASAQWGGGRDRDDQHDYERGRGRSAQMENHINAAANYAGQLNYSCFVRKQYGERGRLSWIQLTCNRISRGY